MMDMSRFSPDALLGLPRTNERQRSRSFDDVFKLGTMDKSKTKDDISLPRSLQRVNVHDAKLNSLRGGSEPAHLFALGDMLLQPNKSHNRRHSTDIRNGGTNINDRRRSTVIQTSTDIHNIRQITKSHTRRDRPMHPTHKSPIPTINIEQVKNEAEPNKKPEFDLKLRPGHVMFSEDKNTTPNQNNLSSKLEKEARKSDSKNTTVTPESELNIKQKKRDSGIPDDDVFSTDSTSGSDSDSEESYPWDMATIVPREPVSAHDSFQGFLKGLRVMMYILIMCSIWILSTANVASVLMLEAAIKKGGIYKQVARFQLIWIISIPYLISFMMSFFKTLFGNHQWPSAKLLFGMLLVESLHVFGLVLLVFHVLPQFGSFYNLGLMCCICLVPALMKLFFQQMNNSNTSVVMNVLKKIIDLVILLVFVAAIALPLLAKHLKLGNLQDNSPHTKTINLWWQIILALTLVSFKYWENFVDTDRGFLKLWHLKQIVYDSRVAFSLISSIWSIGLTIALVHLLEYTTGEAENWNRIMVPEVEPDIVQDLFNDTSPPSAEQYILSYTPGVVVVLSSLIVYYLSLLAIKLWMQRFSFAFPLFCVIPTVIAMIALQCQDILPELPMLAGLQFQFECDIEISNHGYYSWMTIIVWFSFLWLTNHVWYPNIERLSYMDRIFVTRMFTGPLLVQDLLLNRRNDNIDEKIFGRVKQDAELEQIYKNVHGDSKKMKLTQGKVAKEPEKTNNQRPVPMIYACATMWHETVNEMVQLLKSIYRMDADQCSHFIAKKRFALEDPDYYEFEAHVFFDDAMDLDDDDKWVVNDFVILLKNSLREAARTLNFLVNSVVALPKSQGINGFNFSSEVAITRNDVEVKPPIRISTPYGGRLVWRLPGGNNLIVHLKDKNKIRHRKRWSQVMYMYYLLGYKLFDEVPEELESKFKKSMPMKSNKKEENSASSSGVSGSSTTSESNNSSGQKNRSKKSNSPNRQGGRCMSKLIEEMKQDFGSNQHFMKSEIFQNMEESVLQQTENTFILALDGDVDFKPDAVRLLLDRMRINPKTGAACGRIHPIGSSPMVWYQKFEYSVGHWFQKSTEHVLGCVLCSPGCFSLFRGSALLDDNIMKKYTSKATEPSHYLQYDQGEDRWLCTLLLQQGYRIDYTAASDALTYAPETFDEFFNQRRRWTPSTIANIIDLLSDTKNTMIANPNISFFYILYQFFLMISTILGPSTIVLAIASAIRAVFELSVLASYVTSLVPAVGYIIICCYAKPKHQLLVGQLLSVMYAAIMVVVLVGIIQSIVTDSLLDPSLLFLVIISICFVFAGIIHPYEFSTLLHGILYFLCIPAGYLVLMIYSICNMHVVSWGTREVPKRKSKAQQAAEAAKVKSEQKKPSKKSLFSWLRLDIYLESLKDILIQIMPKRDPKVDKNQIQMIRQMKGIRKDFKRTLKLVNPNIPVVSSDSDSSDTEITDTTNSITTTPPILAQSSIEHQAETQENIEDAALQLDDPKNPNWIKDKRLGNGPIKLLNNQELTFWKLFIKKYLKPLPKDAAKEKQLAASMLELRNNASFAFWFINFLWAIFNFMIQRNSHLNSVTIGNFETEPLGFVFLVFFLNILVLQMVGMMIHRWGTFLQLISITELGNTIWKKYDINSDHSVSSKDVVKIINELTRNDGVFNQDLYDSANEEELIYEEIDPKKIIEKSKNFLKNYQRPHRSRETHINMEMIGHENPNHHLRMEHLIAQRRHESRIRSREGIQSRPNIRKNFERHISHLEARHKRHKRIQTHSGQADLHHRHNRSHRRLSRIPEIDVHRGNRDPMHDADMEIRFRRNMKHLKDKGF